MGVWAMIISCSLALERIAPPAKSVITPPGATVLARMPRGPYSTAT